MDKILYGVAYYDEYMPTERLNWDMQMMKKAGINVIRIAESTWASEEISDGVFDFHHVERSIEAAARYGISVIVGTPTYAVPPWLAARYPDIIAETDAAITEHTYGKGSGIYVGCHISNTCTKALVCYAAGRAGIRDVAQEAQFPVNIKSGINTLGRQVHYYFNYSGDCIAQKYLYEDAVELISGKEYSNGQTIQMQPWSVYILEEQI